MAEDPDFTVGDPDGAAPPAPPPKPRRRDKLALLLSDWDLARTPDGGALAGIKHRSHREWMHVSTKGFRNSLTVRFYLEHGAGLSGTALAETVALAEARALSSGDVRQPWRRFAWQDGCIWLDLGGGDPAGERRAVRIAPEGWRIVAADDVPVAFLRAPDALHLPEPESAAASTGDLRTFVNVDSDDELALAWAWLVCAARPFADGGAYPILLLHGEQGSGKSDAARYLQALLDPSTLTGRALPREERDLFISAANRHLVAFDNVSGIGDAFADCLCRIATGGGFSARALHTDSDESIFVTVRPMLVNGIPSTILGRPDLADRAISVELRPLRQRREQAEMRAEFARARPGLLGVLCDGLSAALRNLAATKLVDPPRMMDAATWAEAAAQGLGIEPGRIAAAWRANRGAADRAALEVDDVAQAVVALLAEEERERGVAEWKGSPQELYRKLTDHAGERVSRSNLWPKNPAGLGTKLRRISPGLRSVHRIEMAHGKGGHDGTRWLSLRRL